MNRKDTRRQLLLGGGAVSGAILFLAILVAVQYVLLQHPKRWDLTLLKKYTLADQSKTTLKSFKEKSIPLEVLAFYESKEFGERERVRDLLDQYKDVYSDFSYSFVDPDLQRALAKKHGIDAYPTVVIKAGDKEERITSLDEESITNALLKLLRSEIKKVYFLKGHGELAADDTEPDGMSIARQQIEKQNYQTSDLILAQAPAVPDDAAMLIVAGPKVDPLEPELDSIQQYLKRGGKLMVLLNPFKTPKLAEMLKQYGFETAGDIVVDRLSRVVGGDYLMPVITTYVKFPITKNFKLASFFPEARSVRVTEKKIPEADAKELALTSQASWTITEEQLKSGNANFDEKTGIKGPVSVMAVSTYTSMPSDEKTSTGADGEKPDPARGSDGEPAKPAKGRIVVLGSSQFASNKFFKLEGNADLFMNTVSWLAEEEHLIAIRPKSEVARPLILNAGQSQVVFLVPVVIVPLIWFLAGAFVYIHRRRTASA